VSRANQAHQRNVYFSTEALDRLEAHDWPGNIRELGNLIERVVLLTDHILVSADELDRLIPEVQVVTHAPLASAPRSSAPSPAGGLVRSYESADSHGIETLKEALVRHQGNQSRAAQSLGLTLRQFSYRLRKAGLR
jgi:Nif-specific regulatory protein